LDHNSRRYGDSRIRQDLLRCRLIICNKTSVCRTSHHSGAAIFKQKADESAIQPFSAISIGVIDNQVAFFRKRRRMNLDFSGVGQEKLVPKSLKAN